MLRFTSSASVHMRFTQVIHFFHPSYNMHVSYAIFPVGVNVCMHWYPMWHELSYLAPSVSRIVDHFWFHMPLIIHQAVLSSLTGPVNTGKRRGTMFADCGLILFWGHFSSVYFGFLGLRTKIDVGSACYSEYFYFIFLILPTE